MAVFRAKLSNFKLSLDIPKAKMKDKGVSIVKWTYFGIQKREVKRHIPPNRVRLQSSSIYTSCLYRAY